MLFNSLDFACFLPVVFAIYWLLGTHRTRQQNFLLLVAGYVFYGWWDWRFLFLLFASSVIDFSLGLALSKFNEPAIRRLLLGISLTANLGLLGFFKYFNFFISSFADLMHALGLQANVSSLSVILPVGISFYTFQSISYGFDVYRRQIEPTRDPLTFLAYVSFFPQLLAGPIERATHLLPQFLKPRTVTANDLTDAAKQFTWGLFKKVVIADNCAEIADRVFAGDFTSMSSGHLLVGLLCFTFQIYGDFSGYSDMAVGIARLFGFTLMRNFHLPYFSRDIAEFWRRWHISLSTWFRDYLYIPLGGSRGTRSQQIRNVFIVFLVSGLWHGANWTFVLWGLLHAMLFLPLMLTNSSRSHMEIVASDRLLPSVRDLFKIGLTFSLVSIGWVFFRAESVGKAFSFLTHLGNGDLHDLPEGAAKCCALTAWMLLFEWFGRKRPHPLHIASSVGSTVSFALIFWAILIWGSYGEKQFIYFQF